MYFSISSVSRFALLLATTFSLAHGQSSAPGYFTNFSTIPLSNNTFNFGRHYAVLNLDLINALVTPLASTPQGQAFIKSTSSWINTVHAQNPPPLSIFTRIYSVNARHPEVAGGFAQVFQFNPGTVDDPNTQLYPAFTPKGDDVVQQKIRYYAGTANNLELILASQKIDTVILVRFTSLSLLVQVSHSAMSRTEEAFCCALSPLKLLLTLTHSPASAPPA